MREENEKLILRIVELINNEEHPQYKCVSSAKARENEVKVDLFNLFKSYLVNFVFSTYKMDKFNTLEEYIAYLETDGITEYAYSNECMSLLANCDINVSDLIGIFKNELKSEFEKRKNKNQ